jgi:hypothetical protein
MLGAVLGGVFRLISSLAGFCGGRLALGFTLYIHRIGVGWDFCILEGRRGFLQCCMRCYAIYIGYDLLYEFMTSKYSFLLLSHLA